MIDRREEKQGLKLHNESFEGPLRRIINCCDKNKNKTGCETVERVVFKAVKGYNRP